MQPKQRSSQLNKIFIGILLIAILTLIFIAGYGYSIYSQPNQNDNTAPNSPSPEVTPTPETPPTPRPNESNESASIPTPSVPEFTLKLVDHSYDTPTTYSIDPYTGANVTHTGHHVTNATIDVTIKNQAFPTTISGNTSNLYYNVRFKGHFGEDWSYPYPSFPIWASSGESLYGDFSYALPTQSSSQYTVLSFPASYRSGDEVDFEIEAILGIQYSYDTYFYGGDYHIMPMHESYFDYQSSDWTPTQIFKMP